MHGQTTVTFVKTVWYFTNLNVIEYYTKKLRPNKILKNESSSSKILETKCWEIKKYS